MHFVVDTVSELTYYDNLLIGLTGVLNKAPGVKNVCISKLLPATTDDILKWEQRYDITLPIEFKNFYLSSSGFSFEYEYLFSDNNMGDKVICSIRINSLEDLLPVFGYETCCEPGVKFDGNRYVIKLSLESKLFELAPLSGSGQVLLVYLNPRFAPTIWFRTNYSSPLYFLANNLGRYLRMCIAHLGIVNWQLAYSPIGIPQWTENMFRLLAPNLLPFKPTIESISMEYKEKIEDAYYPEIPINRLNSTVFVKKPISLPDISALTLTEAISLPVQWQQVISVEDRAQMLAKRYISQRQVKTYNKTLKISRRPLYSCNKRKNNSLR